MIIFFWVIFIIFYISIVIVYTSSKTIKNVEFHDGGFLNMGYTTHENRETTPKDMRLGLIWPIIFIWWFFKSIIWILHDYFLNGILLIFGFKYNITKMYKKISNYFSENL